MSPKITQRMVLHLNGGSKFSQMNYQIFVEGKATDVVRVVVTDGRPDYKVTSDALTDANGNDFDLTKKRSYEQTVEWIMAHR